MGLHSSAGRALQRERRGHGFESRWSLEKLLFGLSTAMVTYSFHLCSCSSHHSFLYIETCCRRPFARNLKTMNVFLYNLCHNLHLGVHYMIITLTVGVTWFCLLLSCGDATRDFRGELVKKASTGDWTVNGDGSAPPDWSNFRHSDKFTAVVIDEKSISNVQRIQVECLTVSVSHSL